MQCSYVGGVGLAAGVSYSQHWHKTVPQPVYKYNRQAADLSTSTVDKLLTCLSAREHIHKGGLAGARNSHEAGEDPRSECPTDPSQQLQLTLTVYVAHIRQALALHLLQEHSERWQTLKNLPATLFYKGLWCGKG